MRTRITCDRCALGSVWTSDPKWFLETACHDPRGCRARLAMPSATCQREGLVEDGPVRLRTRLDQLGLLRPVLRRL